MRAAIIKNYGPPENIRISNEAVQPELRSGQVLVKPIATTINPTDIDTRKGAYAFLTSSKSRMQKPLTGLEFSGEIVGLGKNVACFKKGDEVYGYIDLLKGDRTHAQYVAIPADYIAKKPVTISHHEAASLPIGMITAIRALRDKARIAKGQSVLINGASGGVGVYAVQYAKVLGAKVTAVADKKNMDLVNGLGCDHFIDYHKTDFTRSGNQYDAIFDVCSQSRFKQCKPLLGKNGIYITSNPFKDISGFMLSVFSSPKSKYLMVLKGNTKDFEYCTDLVNQKKIKPVVDKIFPFEEIVNAQTYFETHSKKGKIILDM